MKYQELLVWQKSMLLVEAAYRLSQTFPAEERFGLTSQLRRAALSVPCNIAEGHGRKSTGAYVHHLSIATGSLRELETCALIASRLGFAHDDMVSGFLRQSDEIGRMLSGLVSSLNPRS